MKVTDINSNKDLSSFVIETAKDISSGKLRADAGAGLIMELIKFCSKKAISKLFKKMAKYREENYFISLLCAGESGFYTHITKGGESVGEIGNYADPEEALKGAFVFIEEYKVGSNKSFISVKIAEKEEN